MKPRRLPSGSWNVRVMIDGHTYSFTDSNKRAVMARATAFAAEHRENAVNPPLGKCLEDFIEDSRETLSPSTVRAYGSIVRAIRRRNPTIANKRIVSLTNKDIQSIINPLRAPKTQRNYVNFIQVATSRKFTVKYKIREQKHIRVPTDLEVLGLVALFRDSEMEIPIMLGAFGGLRRGEISALTMSDLDGDYIRITKDMILDDSGTWIIKPPKTSSSIRSVLLPRFVADRIRERGHITDLKPNSITNQLRKVQRRLGIVPSYCFHSLRHYSASYLHAQGIPDAYIMARGGWATPTVMQKVYRHALKDKVAGMEEKAVASFPSFQYPFQSE